MARNSWPKGRPRIEVAKQVGYARPTNARDVGNIVVVKSVVEELKFRGPVVLTAWLIDWQMAILVAIVSGVIFCALHWRSFGGDVADYMFRGLPVYVRLSVLASAAVIVGAANWGLTGAFWGMVIATALHTWNNLKVEVEEYSQNKYQFSPGGAWNAWLKNQLK